jgi:hypothetical protein
MYTAFIIQAEIVWSCTLSSVQEYVAIDQVDALLGPLGLQVVKLERGVEKERAKEKREEEKREGRGRPS